MNELEYLKAKNELVKRVTGVPLVQNENIIEHTIKGVDVQEFTPSTYLSSEGCTYCAMYLRHGCDGCPIDDGDNCFAPTSTFIAASRLWVKKALVKDKHELKELGNKLNDELKRRQNDKQ